MGSGDTNARLWDLFTELPSHTLTGHRGWVLCVEWEALERKLVTGGHDSHVSLDLLSRHAREHHNSFTPAGPDMGSQDGKTLMGVKSKRKRTNRISARDFGDTLKRHTKWITSLSREPLHV